MRILAIETSCDETAIAILEAKNKTFKILSNAISSQVKLHAKWGGVVPSLAKREHLKNLPLILKKIKPKKIDLIAVVNGPGLEPALWTGINFAQELAKKWNKPLIPINHLEGHFFSVFLPEKKNSKFKLALSEVEGFPAVLLLVSGGHTQLVLLPARGEASPKHGLGGKYKILGQTRDDAAGEAFDKVARMLKLGYPGGPVIAKAAERNRSSHSTVGSPISHTLPRPMISSKDYDFSFSGLKTAVLYKIKEFKRLTPKIKSEICKEFQQAVIDVLISKTLRAAKEHKAKTIIVAGGVAANKELRKQFKKNIHNSKFLIPNSKFTGDNAAMIALAAYFRKEKSPRANIKAQGNLKLN
ncbi:tRNA (adenosine(37)-N6)-threonylcarbamoyltransferase complex transferase subunit TsaD [Patescibacteria group bacterium]